MRGNYNYDYDEKVMTMMMMMMSVDQTFETGAPFLNEVLLKYALDNNHVNINTNANDLSYHEKDKKDKLDPSVYCSPSSPRKGSCRLIALLGRAGTTILLFENISLSALFWIICNICSSAPRLSKVSANALRNLKMHVL